MDFRLLARSLRARPTPCLQQQTQLHRVAFLNNGVRYNSSTSSPSPPFKPTSPTDQPSTAPEAAKQAQTPSNVDGPHTAARESAPRAAQQSRKPVSDFDDILSRLDLNKPREAPSSQRRIFSDSLSRAVGEGAQSSYRARSRAPLPTRKVELKLGPTLGRQVHVEPERGTDLGAALRKLQATLAQNSVRNDAHSQKFHVRKGMVRKQQKMMRWKKLFKFSFQGTVKKIQRMQAQGW
ncbi:Ribosomal protein S21 [Penicillium griseofulvum]|uniref:Ribosomal protein S21 n=1 Tax=Penicillium patulum TaxID=5078 RepID=A0A135LYK6_PENPA|nr:Ribosomal protein S21 [Penicillium griseofulvum]KXG54046.1 Ribosomal protein S21 [Penicillium griseofulvum]